MTLSSVHPSQHNIKNQWDLMRFNFIMSQINITTPITATTPAMMGAKIASADSPIAAPVSASPMTGLAAPAVVAVETARVVADVALMALAVPPPATIASPHVKAGSSYLP